MWRPGPVADEKGNWKWQPGLAESITVSDDRKTITIKLNKNARFESGNPVTVDDWLYTFNRALVGEGYAKLLLGMLTVESMDQIKVLDDATLEMSLSKPNPFAEKLLNVNVIVPIEKAIVEPQQTADDPTAHGWLKANATACGPYKLKSWTPGTGWELEPNPNYWDLASSRTSGKSDPDAQTAQLS
jgi:peptide/nickel transport system substrate-binding protein